jgi:Protein of unknown function (DUF3309)
VSLGTILLIILSCSWVAHFRHGATAESWGYGPSGGVGLLVVILIILLLMGRI